MRHTLYGILLIAFLFVFILLLNLDNINSNQFPLNNERSSVLSIQKPHSQENTPSSLRDDSNQTQNRIAINYEVPVHNLKVKGCIYDANGSIIISQALGKNNTNCDVIIYVFENYQDKLEIVFYSMSTKVDKNGCYEINLLHSFENSKKYYLLLYAYFYDNDPRQRVQALFKLTNQTIYYIMEIDIKTSFIIADLYMSKLAKLIVETTPVPAPISISLSYKIGGAEWLKACYDRSSVPVGITLKAYIYQPPYLPLNIYVSPLHENEERHLKIDLKHGPLTLKGKVLDTKGNYIEDSLLNIGIWFDGTGTAPLMTWNIDAEEDEDNGVFMLPGLPDKLIDKIEISYGGAICRTLLNVNPSEELTVIIDPKSVDNDKEVFIYRGLCTNRERQPLSNIYVQLKNPYKNTLCTYKNNLNFGLFTNEKGAYEFKAEQELLGEIHFIDQSGRYKTAIFRNVVPDTLLEVILD
ncbi:MAG: hypothetical protein HY606_06110 [Planctomycetes bacterium]|nr:hypothetical protein [Planctomycetota bacterium]